MFIHIGNENVIRSREIVLIIDYDVISSSAFMEEMIEKHKKQENVVQLTSVVKSAVFTIDRIYFSPLSVLTLKKRSSMTSMISRFAYSPEEE